VVLDVLMMIHILIRIVIGLRIVVIVTSYNLTKLVRYLTVS
jgi:hypothetical protein